MQEMTIHEKMDALFAKNNKNRILSTKEIKDKVLDAFPDTIRGSVIPSDYCYNIVNKGIKFDHHLFEQLSRGIFKVLGKNFPFKGDIRWKGKKVGEWQKDSSEPILYEMVGKC